MHNDKQSIFINGDSLWLKYIFLKEDLPVHQKEMEEFVRLADQYKDGTKIWTVANLGGINNRKITFSELKNSIFSNLNYHGNFQTDDATGKEFTMPDSFVFVCNNELIFYGLLDDEFVKVLCLEHTRQLSDLAIEKTIDILFNFAQYNLMLADWRTKMIVDLSNKEKILAYLNKLKG